MPVGLWFWQEDKTRAVPLPGCIASGVTEITPKSLSSGQKMPNNRSSPLLILEDHPKYPVLPPSEGAFLWDLVGFSSGSFQFLGPPSLRNAKYWAYLEKSRCIFPGSWTKIFIYFAWGNELAINKKCWNYCHQRLKLRLPIP